MWDKHTNLAYGIVATAPSPALSGNSLTLQEGQGADFPTDSFPAVAWPAPDMFPTKATAEIVYVTSRASDTFIITRGQENSTAKVIVAGWNFAANSTVKTIRDIEQFIDSLPARTQTLTNKTLSTGSSIDASVGVVEVLKKVYPVGTPYINFTDSRNPSLIFGFGTWVSEGVGRVLVGIDPTQTEFATAGQTGGAKTHQLTVNEMPSHTHDVTLKGNLTKQEGGGGATVISIDTYTQTTGSRGGDQPHNNLQPYIVAYMWRRTA